MQYVYIYIYKYVYTHIYMFVCMPTHIYIHKYVYIHLYTYIYIKICINLFIYTYIYIYVYISMYVYAHIYAYIYSYLHIHTIDIFQFQQIVILCSQLSSRLTIETFYLFVANSKLFVSRLAANCSGPSSADALFIYVCMRTSIYVHTHLLLYMWI